MRALKQNIDDASSTHKVNNKFSKLIRMKAKSTSCRQLQKQIEKDYSTAKVQHNNKNQFIPFYSERRLGKLIANHSDPSQPATARRPTDEELIEKINFKNFHQIYKTVMNYENKRYSELTRRSQQRDLINKEWKINDLSRLPQKKKEVQSTNKKLVCSLQKNKKQAKKQTNRFEKMDQFLFRKMSLVRQPHHNPQLNEMYNNYIEICEMNENIKRKELASKRNDRVIRV